MGIFGAMFTGVSGLNAQAQSMGMIADNIANVNTVGFKGTQAKFSTLVTEAATSSSFTPGGVMTRPFQMVDRQGLLQSTGNSTDLAIVGSGFFVTNTASDGSGEYLFSRAGSWNPDANGNLRNTSGAFLRGWPTDTGGVPTVATTVLSNTQSVNVSTLGGAAVATSTVALGANLPAGAATGSSQTVTIQIFDSLGAAHNLPATFTKTATVNQWTLTVGNPTLASTGAASGNTTFASTTVNFNGDGTLGTTVPGTLPNIAISGFTTGASDSSISANIGTANQSDGMTQFASSFTTNFINQNGVPPGSFTGVTVGDTGLVTAQFDNGQTRTIFQLPLVTFSNPNGLQAENGNLYRETSDSGQALINNPGAGGAGGIAAGALEGSTVDLAGEFTNMIITQQAYSANARIITAADEMLDEVVRIAR